MRTKATRFFLTLAAVATANAAEMPRPPSVPLVVCDPYFSLWSPHDKLTDGATTHWTGKKQRLECTATIDGTTVRLLGNKDAAAVPAMPQTGLEVTPTRTLATFEGSGISLRLTFTTPALPDDIDILSRPVTYLTFDAASNDGKDHKVSVTFDANAEISTNTPSQKAETSKVTGIDGLTVLRAGSTEQNVLGKSGDDIRIDWGYLYLAAPTAAVKTAEAGDGSPGAAGERQISLSLDLGNVGAKPASSWLMLAYDDIYSIQYMGANLRPFWRRNGWEAADLIKASATQRESLLTRCEKFDAEFTNDLKTAGGDNYAYLGALAYRQCFAAGKFVADRNGQPLQFSKENHSNGCIATSDVFYPMAPQFLLLGPSLAKSFIVPFMEYAVSDRWKFPFAPHDLGTYPHANGQVYGGGEKTEHDQMPVEESGNLLLLFGAVAKMEGNADFAGRYWPQLVKWADYLKAKGFDPENQLCTDDFAGHLAHNVNLSLKAICGIGAFANLCELRGDKELAAEYRKTAEEFAARWIKETGDTHSRLAFDRPGTWSQKYNLVWDKILDLKLFPDSVSRKEVDFYLTKQNKYGLPLDNRREYTKLDWIMWTATLTRDRKDFDALLAPIRKFLDETPDRAPMGDWYKTDSGKKEGFTARPVVGGVFLELLYHPQLWAKYAGRDKTKAANWAPMPKPPVVTNVVPTAEVEKSTWSYTTSKPSDNWFAADLDTSSWKTGKGGFGKSGTPGVSSFTPWTTSDIWIRREFTFPELSAVDLSKLHLEIYYDEDSEIYINGVLAASPSGFSAKYVTLPISEKALKTLRPGKNTIAVHCHQTSGGQFIDVGLATVVPAE